MLLHFALKCTFVFIPRASSMKVTVFSCNLHFYIRKILGQFYFLL